MTVCGGSRSSFQPKRMSPLAVMSGVTVTTSELNGKTSGSTTQMQAPRGAQVPSPMRSQVVDPWLQGVPSVQVLGQVATLSGPQIPTGGCRTHHGNGSLRKPLERALEAAVIDGRVTLHGFRLDRALALVDGPKVEHRVEGPPLGDDA